MIAYPNSGNISLFLLRVKTDADDLGNQVLRLVGSKEVVGMTSSIKYIYVPNKDTIYIVERSYQNGMWMELSVSQTNIKKEDIAGWNL